VYPALKRFINQQQWLDTIGDPLQQYVNSLFTSAGAGDAGKQVKNVLNGVWLGHPLHPMLTDVPVGAWTTTVVLDAVASMSDNDGLETAADLSLATGLLAAVGTAITGITDWTDTYGEERKVGLLHGLMMTTSVMAYTGSLISRLAGNRSNGVALANIGYAVMAAGAYLGGEEVFDIGYPINHTAFIHGPGDFTQVMAENDLEPDTPTKAQVGNTTILLVKQDDRIYALDDTCVHAGCSLSGGHLDGRSIVCPCHGSQYDLQDGSVINGPATMPEPHYDVRVQNGVIEVKQAE
jgi:nitrite reductase/ring-hydroxylating ferredoxin subunit/uncharacterized membrane protein